MASSRTSLWSVLPPRDSECDLFAPEIAKWISVVIDRQISSDLIKELEKGDVLCELFHKLCPNERFGRYHRNAMMDIWKRDNINIFADATYRYGVPKSALMNYTFFESKDEAMLITSLLVFVKVLIEKQGAEAIHLPESFIKTICNAYLETRILHRPGHTNSSQSSVAPVKASEPSTAEDASSTLSAAPQPIAISEQEQLELDALMQAEVNDMLNDILDERRRTCGMWASEDEAASDDSFDEKYVPQKEEENGKDGVEDKEEEEEEESVGDAPVEEVHIEKGEEEKVEEVKQEEIKVEKQEEKQEGKQEIQQEKVEEKVEEEIEEEIEEKVEEEKVEEVMQDVQDQPKETKEAKEESNVDEFIEESRIENASAETEEQKVSCDSEAQPVEEEKVDKPKEAKSSGFWWKSLLVASAVASIIIAKRMTK